MVAPAYEVRYEEHVDAFELSRFAPDALEGDVHGAQFCRVESAGGAHGVSHGEVEPVDEHDGGPPTSRLGVERSRQLPVQLGVEVAVDAVEPHEPRNRRRWQALARVVTDGSSDRCSRSGRTRAGSAATGAGASVNPRGHQTCEA